MAGLVGWVLRHRRLLVTAYAVALHCLVYYLLLYSGSCPQARPRPPGAGQTLAGQTPAQTHAHGILRHLSKAVASSCIRAMRSCLYSGSCPQARPGPWGAADARGPRP